MVAAWTGIVIWLLAVAPVETGAVPASTKRGVGPFSLQTTRGTAKVRLLRREDDLVWLLQMTRQGDYVQTGLPVADIIAFEIDEERLFAAAQTAAGEEAMVRVQQELRRVIDELLPYRDLPGMIVDQALMVQARLYEKRERWEKAYETYEQVLSQDYAPEQAEQARLRAGVCLSRMGRHENAVTYLAVDGLREDDLDLVSEVYYARGAAFQAMGRYDEAIMSYLYLVVFYPFVNDNEPRCLAAVLPCYAALTDWGAAYKTARILATEYDGTEWAETARAFREQHGAQLAAAPSVRDSYEADQFEEEEGVYDDFE